MSTETTTVEKKVETAVAQPEKETLTQTTEVDYEAILKAKDDELAQTRTERENYRKGMLKAKGKLPDEDDNSSNEEDIDAKIERKVQEKLLSTREAQLQADKDKVISDMAKKLKETTLALKNRGQISTSSGQGSNEDRPEGKKRRLFLYRTNQCS